MAGDKTFPLWTQSSAFRGFVLAIKDDRQSCGRRILPIGPLAYLNRSQENCKVEFWLAAGGSGAKNLEA